MDDNDELGYISSVVSPFTTPKEAPSVDAADEKALKRIVEILQGQIELYHTIEGVKQFNKEFNIEQRFELCDHYVQLLSTLLLLVNNAINSIKESQNG